MSVFADGFWMQQMSLEDVWRNLGERISFNTRQTASEIPELPGVYEISKFDHLPLI